MNITCTRNTVAAALIFSVLSGASTLCQAETRALDTEIRRVSYADLDLDKTEGQNTLHQRLRNAAQEVCGEVYSKVPRDIRDNRDCREYAYQRALRQVEGQEVAAVAVIR